MVKNLTHSTITNIYLGGQTYQISAISPRDSVLVKTREPERSKLLIRHRDGARELTSFSYYRPEKIFRTILMSVSSLGDEAPNFTNDDNIEEDETYVALREDKPAQEILARLDERAREKSFLLRAHLLEIAPDPVEDDFAFIQIFASGLAPIVLIGRQGFSFPVRSGLPGGYLPEWFTEQQSMDWARGDELNVYTEAPDSDSGDSLREFHDLLRNRRIITRLPWEMVLLRLSYIANGG